MSSCYGVKPAQLLEAFDQGCGGYSMDLMTRNPDDIVCPPVLLPGEILILQQDKVTCVNTLSHAATGALHLTNYRVIFSGKYMKNTNSRNEWNPDELSKLGYRYQEERRLISRVPSNIRKFVPSIKKFRKSSSKATLTRDLSFEGTSTSPTLSRLSIKNDKNVFDIYIDDEILVSIPVISIYDVKKYAKQYLQTEKLQMLNNGIEIITSNYMSIKLCLAEEHSFDAEELIKEILKQAHVKDIFSSFAYTYTQSLVLPKHYHISFEKVTPNLFHLDKENKRLDMTASSQWKEKEQSICTSYPSKVILPKTACNATKLKKWSKFHDNGTYPIVVWKHPKKRNVLMRSGSTRTPRGDSEQRCLVDEEIINDICQADCGGTPKKLVIYMDKPCGNTVINGLTVKEGETYFYPHCELILLDNLPDIFSTHQSALKLQNALGKCDESSYLSRLEESGWFRELEILLDYALCIAVKLNVDNTNVLISLGCGLERAAQISSLVQLLMDPYFRTMDGFQILIQKEWLSVKYPFRKRNLVNLSSPNELSPLFLQFLDCVWQLSHQFPTTFEFNDPFLELLAQHSYSGRFDTFIDEKKVSDRNVSLWTYINILMLNHEMLHNFNYDKGCPRSILPATSCLPHLKVWTWFTHYKKEESLYVASMCAAVEMEKLQKEYMEFLHKHSELLDKLSQLDALTDSSCNSLVSQDRGQDAAVARQMSLMSTLSSSGSIYELDDEEGAEEDELGESMFEIALGNKSDAVKEFIDNIDDECNISTVGKSSFYGAKRGESAISLLKALRNEVKPKGWNDSEKFTCLKDYLINEGVYVETLVEVAVFKMMVTGYLVKQGGQFKSWKKRFFVADFRKKYVAYFESSVGTKPKGVFSYLNIRSVVPSQHNKYKHLFIVETRGRTYYIRAPSEPVMNIWIACLTVPLSCLASS